MTTFTRAASAFTVKEGPDATKNDFEVSTTGAVKLPVAAVAAAGSGQGDAAALSFGINVVSAADGTKGVILPVAEAGAIVIIKNTASAILKIYPATGGAINAVAANGAFSTTANPVPLVLFATSATQWYTLPLVPT